MKYTILMLMDARKEWLSLSRTDRNAFNAKVLNPIFAQYADRVSMRLCDAEAFSGVCSDFAIFETEDLPAYYFLIEELRNTPLFSAPYFDIKHIIPGIEGGFVAFENQQR
jgi:hypothetical protein